MSEKLQTVPIIRCIVLLLIIAPTIVEGQDPSYFVIPEVNGMQDLDVYGEWKETEHHGRVWRPFVVEGWRPFYYGHWLWTTHGWTWIAYEPFGWIVFHYGEWAYDRELGWFWIPGSEWFPAPVLWFKYSVYTGWAAKHPQGIILPQPWISTKIVFWNVVKIENLLREKVGDFVRSPLAERPAKTNELIERAPGKTEVEHIAKQRIVVAELEEESVSGSSITLKRLKLPEKETERVERHRSVVVKRLLKPKRHDYED